MARALSIAFITACAVPIFSGCLADPGEALSEADEEQIATAQALFFPVQAKYWNCPGADTTAGRKLRLATEQLSELVYDDGGRTFRACMNDAFIGPLTSANGVWSQFLRPTLTNIYCSNNLESVCSDLSTGGWWGCGSIDIQGEHITLANQMIIDSDVSADTIAGVIAHELAHNYGHRHPGVGRDIDASVTERVEACAAHKGNLPVEQSRTRGFAGEVEMGPAGGWGAIPAEAGCVTSFVGALRVRSGQEIDGLQTRCHTSDEFGTWHGGTGGTLAPASSTTCPTGEVLVGVRGRSGQRLDALQMVCAPITNTSDRTSLTTLGGTGGTIFESFCPSGKAVKRLRLRAGTKIHQIQLVCDVPGERAGNAHVEGIVDGGQYDPIFKQRCSGDGALRALRGHAGERLDRLYGICRATEHSPFVVTNIEHTLVPILGGTGGGAFESRCTSSELMVGVQVRAGNRIDAIGAICAPSATWVTGNTSSQRLLPLNGGSGGGLVTKRCDPGEFLVGFNLNAGNEITGLQIACRDLQL